MGAPHTPNALNDGNAPFPEYHNVCVELTAFDHFAETDKWPEITQIIKELMLIYQNDNDELVATFEVPGHSYQLGKFSRLELTLKDGARYPEMPGNWAYFSFGHNAPPYAPTVTHAMMQMRVQILSLLNFIQFYRLYKNSLLSL